MIDQDWPYQFANLPINDLFVDEAYQRLPVGRQIDEIARNYDRNLFGALRVSARSDDSMPTTRYAIVDGQQRWLATRPIEETVPSLVHFGLTIQQEAELFAKLNFMLAKVNPYYYFNAMRVAGNRDFLDMDAIVEALGLHIASGSGPRNVGAVATVEAIYRADADLRPGPELPGREVLRRTLNELVLAWLDVPDAWADARKSGMLRGTARWVWANPLVPEGVLAAALRHVLPKVIIALSKELHAGQGSGKGRKVEVAIEQVFVKHAAQEWRRPVKRRAL